MPVAKPREIRPGREGRGGLAPSKKGLLMAKKLQEHKAILQFWAPEIGAQGLLAKCYYGDYTRLDPKMLKGFTLGAKGERN